ncbi:3-hydroxyisobutyrate dehydrogenase-like beta-hydroxyacid dehydrogenase [Azomonas macrocytogenes]|uniref:3-hydroxyisobutyrate dehydrogenase-like beta-hydroxyacid dehydrogenase n=2 Tax=Azomonas macrocytogenes TaxID=69962 RepID=A0A839T316_AZOMA|nr:NAD(P)-dependent oxidoreductase [Azomonas macrocytogenes]MBB3103050.1 3-hydroxyisobutyrate dehydrogenase-like beta-hydroxyacid dehydrogenase [Azomonas macrocytogenes]
MRIGFIGLGGMGSGMAANLLKAGHEVRVWNRSREAVERLLAQGAVPLDEPHQAFAADVTISMLADDVATRAVLLDSGALAAAQPGAIHLSMATLSAAFVGELVEHHRQAGVDYIAAPVFGRTDMAAAGKLNIVVAGPPAAIAKVQPLLDAMGQKTWPLGEEPVRANVVKIAGNFMLASAIEAMGEASALVQGYGVEAGDMLEILTNTLFAAPAYKGYGAMIAERRFEPAAFKLTLGLKDVGLALSAGQARNVPLPFASVLRDNLLEAVAQGEGDLDWAALGGRAMKRAGQA